MIQTNRGPQPADLLQDLIASHGARRVVVALAAALLRSKLRKARPPDAMRRLNRHLLRDIGLSAEAPDLRDPLL